VDIAPFIARRIAFGVLTLFVVSVLVFLLTHALGDPAAASLGRDAQQPAVLAARRAELGLDRPLVAQYGDWLGGVLTGDLGRSYVNGRPVGADLRPRVVNSLLLMAAAAAVALPSSLLIGVHAARRRDRAFDRTTNGLTLVLAAIPEFVLATLLVIVFSVGVFELLPAVSSVRGTTRPWDDLDGMVLPTLTLALVAVPYVVRSTRAAMIEVLDSDYIEMARLNGIPARTVLWRHALPNTVGPTIQVVALSLAFMAGGVVVVERVFNYPGVGAALVEAIDAHDVPVVQAIAMSVAVLYVALNTLADVGTVLVTPRLRTAPP
jgi:peptide/nickel transport system permease protein